LCDLVNVARRFIHEILHQICVIQITFASIIASASQRHIMYIEFFKSKIHRVRVTQADLNYIGSITIDEDLLDAANIREGEKVQIVNNNNGERIETYTIRGERGSGVICLNGAAARRVQVGDIVIIISYCWLTPDEANTHRPIAIFPDENNRLAQKTIG
jgi:aspartate 1-decarboxylase